MQPMQRSLGQTEMKLSQYNKHTVQYRTCNVSKQHHKPKQHASQDASYRPTVSTRAMSSAELQSAAVSQNGANQPGLVFAPAAESCWDGGGVNNPVVRFFRRDEEEKWMMWYNGYSCEAAAQDISSPSVGVALSQDGIHWQRASQASAASQTSGQEGKCVGPNEDWWWHDTRHLSLGDVQMSSSEAVNTGEGVYWMYYSGGDFEESTVPEGMPGLQSGNSQQGLRTRIGLALSQDGFNFARIEADHHTGALFDAGEEQDWDRTGNAAPQVLTFGATDRKMYYSAYDPDRQKWIVGLATSKDGFRWRKQGPIFEGGSSSDFDALGAAHHHIVRDVDSKRYVMFYEGVDRSNVRRISIAVSKDGVKNWKRLGRPILEAASSHAWDSAGVGAPCPVSMAGGRWRLYYSGWAESSNRRAIGLAITDKEDAETFEGVRIAFKRRTL